MSRRRATGAGISAGVAASLTMAAMLLAACGSATSDGGDTTTTASSLSKVPQTSGTSLDSQATSAAGDAAGSHVNPQDQGAREISVLPTTTAERSGSDANYLNVLKGKSININGVEDQLIGTAAAVCQAKGAENADVMAIAVAGQLVSQGRTQGKPEEVATTIASAAKSAYC